MMKKIACAALALTLLGSTAAQAQGWGGHGGGWGGHGGWGHGHGWHGGDWALGLGLGFLALGAVAAASHDHYNDDRDAYERGRYDQQRMDHDGYGDQDGYRDDDRPPPPDQAPPNGDRHYEDEGDGY